MRHRTVACVTAGILAAALVIGGCGGDDGEEAPSRATPAPTEEASGGLQIWSAQGCGSCHTLAAANASGRIGPNLDETLKGKPEDFIRESIVAPDAEIARGFSAGVMPKDFGQKLSDAELDQLVDFIAKSTGG